MMRLPKKRKESRGTLRAVQRDQTRGKRKAVAGVAPARVRAFPTGTSVDENHDVGEK